MRERSRVHILVTEVHGLCVACHHTVLESVFVNDGGSLVCCSSRFFEEADKGLRMMCTSDTASVQTDLTLSRYHLNSIFLYFFENVMCVITSSVVA